jgi:hypothetical protein
MHTRNPARTAVRRSLGRRTAGGDVLVAQTHRSAPSR